MEAIGKDAVCWSSDEFPDLDLTEAKVPCPVQRCKEVFDIENTITHLNDDHRWKRERIANWVELQESIPAPEPLPEITESEVVLIGN